MKPVIVLFENEIRLSDHVALLQASQSSTVIPLIILDDDYLKEIAPGAVSQWWLYQSLNDLTHQLESKGSFLTIGEGDASFALAEVASFSGAEEVYLTDYNSNFYKKRHFDLEYKNQELRFKYFPESSLTNGPYPMNGSGEPYKVFTPFWNKLKTQLSEPECMGEVSFKKLTLSSSLSSTTLEKRLNMRQEPKLHEWQPGEAGASKALEFFLMEKSSHYKTGRDFPALSQTSQLSAHLHFGEISINQILSRLQNYPHDFSDGFLRQLAWRDFSRSLRNNFSDIENVEWNPKFRNFPWFKDDKLLKVWQEGKTGYPLVDAGMRELNTTGTMHNRVRMVVASFLIKHLGLNWRYGQSYFLDKLVDADRNLNSFNWQWVAGSGADASPYIRIFNPILQSQKFDKNGDYIKKWVPELRHLSSKEIHEPWNKSVANYAKPIVDHVTARAQALKKFNFVKG
jgi:deoxyribodipyrimidine photo-lyase